MTGIRLFVLMILLLGCSKNGNVAAPAITPPPGIIKILYIGNSLTQANDLPSMVTAIAKQDSVDIIFKDMSIGGTSLEDHWNQGLIQTEIRNGKYNFVILQQGPSSLPASQALLMEYVQKIKTVCVINKSNVCVYMVWPEKARLSFLDNVIDGYTQSALQTQSILAPGGLAWKHAWNLDPTLPLYSSDDFHPSIMGSFLAALTIYGSIKQKKEFNFLSYHDLPWKTAFTGAQLTILKQAALKALGH